MDPMLLTPMPSSEDVYSGATHTPEHETVYITRIIVSVAVLVLLVGERIHLDEMQYRKASVACLLAITGLVMVSFLAWKMEFDTGVAICYKSSEAVWVLLNCSVAHLPLLMLDEPPRKLKNFLYFSLFLVAGSWSIQLRTKFNAVYVANAMVSIYTLMLLHRVLEYARRSQTHAHFQKPTLALYHAELTILFINIAVVWLTMGTDYPAFPYKLAVYIVYWIRIYMVLLEFGRQFCDKPQQVVEVEALSNGSSCPSGTGAWRDALKGRLEDNL